MFPVFNLRWDTHGRGEEEDVFGPYYFLVGTIIENYVKAVF